MSAPLFFIFWSQDKVSKDSDMIQRTKIQLFFELGKILGIISQINAHFKRNHLIIRGLIL